VRRTGVGAGSARLDGASQTVLVASSQVVEFGFAGLGVAIKTEMAFGMGQECHQDDRPVRQADRLVGRPSSAPDHLRVR
jgi:hypothetical protein